MEDEELKSRPKAKVYVRGFLFIISDAIECEIMFMIVVLLKREL